MNGDVAATLTSKPNRLAVPQLDRDRSESKRIPTADAWRSFKGADLGDEGGEGLGGPQIEAIGAREHKPAPSEIPPHGALEQGPWHQGVGFRPVGRLRPTASGPQARGSPLDLIHRWP